MEELTAAAACKQTRAYASKHARTHANTPVRTHRQQARGTAHDGPLREERIEKQRSHDARTANPLGPQASKQASGVGGAEGADLLAARVGRAHEVLDVLGPLLQQRQKLLARDREDDADRVRAACRARARSRCGVQAAALCSAAHSVACGLCCRRRRGPQAAATFGRSAPDSQAAARITAEGARRRGRRAAAHRRRRCRTASRR